MHIVQNFPENPSLRRQKTSKYYSNSYLNLCMAQKKQLSGDNRHRTIYQNKFHTAIYAVSVQPPHFERISLLR